MSKQHIKARNAARTITKEKRVSKALTLIDAGNGITATARELGVNRRTLQRNLQQVRERTQLANAEKFDSIRDKHHAELSAMIDFVLESPEMSDSEVAAHFRLYKSDIAKLLGINREKASTNVAVAVGGNLTPEYIEIAKAMADVEPADRPKVLEFARSLAKPIELTADCFPPARKELTA